MTSPRKTSPRKTSPRKKPVSQLGRKIYALMRAANFDYIRDFEKATGVRPDSIRRLIGGYAQNLPVTDLNKIAEYLRIPLRSLLSIGDGEEIPGSNLVPDATCPCWYEVRSDEMMPTLKAGDRVLVDVGVNTVQNAGIFLVETPTTMVFRRLSLNPISNKICVTVDNQTYPYHEEVELGTLVIKGRVIGVFQRL